MSRLGSMTPQERASHPSVKARAGVNKLIELGREDLTKDFETSIENANSRGDMFNMQEIADVLYDVVEMVKQNKI